MVTTPMDPTRFHIEHRTLHVGNRPIGWALVFNTDLVEEDGEVYHWRTAEIPFESGDKLRLSWSDGSYSDNFERRQPEGGLSPFIETPLSVEIDILYAGESDWGDLVQGWVSVPQILTIINTLAHPRGGVLTTERSFLP